MIRTRRLLYASLGLAFVLAVVFPVLTQIDLSLRLRMSADELMERIGSRSERIASIMLYDNYMVVSFMPLLGSRMTTITLVPLLRDGQLAFDVVATEGDQTVTDIVQRAESISDRLQANITTRLNLDDDVELVGVGVRAGHMELVITTDALNALGRFISGERLVESSTRR